MYYPYLLVNRFYYKWGKNWQIILVILSTFMSKQVWTTDTVQQA